MRINPRVKVISLFVLALLAIPPAVHATPSEAPVGYYRQPALHGDTVVFVAEGDLWRVPAAGGEAVRLTSHPGEEEHPVVSPDGETVAFTATYEGPREVYTMPLQGGLPTRRTWGSSNYLRTTGWAPDGQLLYATMADSTLPGVELARLDVSVDAAQPTFVPLFGAADGSYDEAGKTLFFTRYWAQPSHTKRYEGGTAQSIWKLPRGAAEATPLTSDFPGTSRHPMWWQGRIYFVSDRDGTMNLWSMTPDGGDLQQLTHHQGWDVHDPSLDAGRVVYQLGADLWLYDAATQSDHKIPITLRSDLDQTREHWVDEPMEYLTAAHISADGERVALTARGQVFVVPRHQGRLTEAGRRPGVRYRNARFMPDGKALVVLSDESGEVELWRLPANGVGAPAQWTTDGDILRWEAVPSPDGRDIAHDDKAQRLFVYDTETGRNRQIDASEVSRFSDLAWSPDGKWLAYVATAGNLFSQIKLYSVTSGQATLVTTDHFDSYSPAWSPDGKWLYLLSDRHLESVVQGVWGSYAPEPFLDKKSEIFALALAPGERSPFAPDDELHPPSDQTDEEGGGAAEKGKQGAAKQGAPPPEVEVVLDGLEGRLQKVPVDPGNYRGLAVTGKALYFLSQSAGDETWDLEALPVKNRDREVKTIVPKVEDYELSGDGTALLVRREKKLFVLDAAPQEDGQAGPGRPSPGGAGPGQADLSKAALDLSDWKLSLEPREEWQQMFTDAWRLERDYFYDRHMVGVDWPAMREKYAPLVARVTSRTELSDLVAQMVSELSTLHTFVRGGDMRQGPDDIAVGSLGARFTRDREAGGWRVEHVFQGDPDHPSEGSPLSQPAVDVHEGDVITQINGEPTLEAPALGALLRNQAGRQVLLHVQQAGGGEKDVIAEPISQREDADLRYTEWEESRRRRVEEAGDGALGYVHLRAMGAGNFSEWAEGYYPAFNRKGLIIDVRHNRGGNIDSWILSSLLRKVWMYWTQPVGKSPLWNMQYGFRGHMVVLCDAWTASDGEAFTEGFRRLHLGKVLGTRTWGGEVWLTSSNYLKDGGIATAAEFGVYGPEGDWLIEGHGVDPDVVVDNPPHATFEGQDAQLEAAIELLQKEIAQEPVQPPQQPPFPDKSRPREN